MKKLMKQVSKSVVSVAVLLGIMVVPAYAAARVAADPCPYCEHGTVEERITRVYQHDESFECKHGYPYGEDVYAVYEVEEVIKCDSCSYDISRTYEQHVFTTCHGYGHK